MTHSNSSNLGTKRHFVITKIRIVTRLNNFFEYISGIQQLYYGMDF
uniref:Uncharacterized protein n=1 Tax=Siphoviridae sp. ctHip2 TaxID=2827830 RepID=A0A8S5RWN3_9CAUD|nr:MAG TPA: hypothetical protein [Siphoviridae sp. ctHip2]